MLHYFNQSESSSEKGLKEKGRPRKTSLREDRLLLSNRKLNSSQILKQWTLTSNVSVCPRTVRGRLLEIGLRSCKARPKPLLTEFQLEAIDVGKGVGRLHIASETVKAMDYIEILQNK
ncbi:hypothetical protein TNCV_1399481 [Trichonephila clavipes]|nr:hypothetical protein TNCV_1399481 [Trichonephila clavipes]